MLLGGHVVHGAHAHARLGLARADVLGNAQVEDLELAVLGDQHVLGLDVPVQHPCPVHVGDRAQQLLEHRPGPLPGDGAGLAPDDLAQRLAVHQLHHQRQHPAVQHQVVDLADPRVVELQAQASLTLEALGEGLVAGDVGVHHLDGDLAPLLGGELGAAVLAPVDRAHAPVADVAEDPVGADLVGDAGGAAPGRGGRLGVREQAVPLGIELLAADRALLEEGEELLEFFGDRGQVFSSRRGG